MRLFQRYKVWMMCCALGLWVMLTIPAHAIFAQIGDVDSFGFSPADIALNGPDGNPADRNNDGFLTAGDTLPDLNGDGYVATGRGDDFDNRSAAEAADANARWTDISLSTSFSGDPGNPPAANFTFVFAVPTAGDFDYGVNHFLNIVAGDLDVPPVNVLVDGVNLPLVGVGSDDGLITLTHLVVPWAMLSDGVLNVSLSASYNEPYVAIDYITLDTNVREQPVVPEPATMALVSLGLLGVAGMRRRRRA